MSALDTPSKPLASTAAPPVAAPAGPRAGRHNIYRRPHAGLRACMCEALPAAARTDVDDPVDVAALATRMHELIALFEAHLVHENTLVHPAIEARAPGLTTPIARDHEEHVEALSRLAADVEAIRRALRDRRADALAVLCRDLEAFVAHNLVHMAAEERDHNAALWDAYDDHEILAIEAKVIAAILPAQMPASLRWIVPALTPPERLAMMRRLRDTAPAPAYQAALAVIERHLDDRGWAKLAEGLAAR